MPSPEFFVDKKFDYAYIVPCINQKEQVVEFHSPDRGCICWLPFKEFRRLLMYIPMEEK